jgi:hypothetical protein
MLMNGQPVLVAGVAPRGFRGLLTGRDPDFFAPMSMMGTISPGMDGNDRGGFLFAQHRGAAEAERRSGAGNACCCRCSAPCCGMKCRS